MYTVMYNGETAFSKALMVARRPIVPSSSEDFNAYDIRGRDGKLYEMLGTYQDIEIPIEFNFITKPDNWILKIRQATKWLYGREEQKLYLGDNTTEFFNVKNVVVTGTDREIIESGTISAVFTCEAFIYTDEGQNKENISVWENQYDEAHPIYYITGEGVANLEVNGKIAKVNVGQNVTIDTEKKIAYREDGTIVNTSITGEYEDIFLRCGENKISISNGFKVSTKTNERYRI